jgi:integrase
MSIYKRGGTWWTDFSVNGQRFRQSLDTTDWREAQSKEKDLIGQATAGNLVPSSQLFAKLAFVEAADRYVADRLAHLAPRSIVTEQERLKPLRAFFSALTLKRISSDSIRKYIANRKQKGVANRTVNMELGVLRRILKRAKRWHLLVEDIKPLPERHNVGQALQHGEKLKLLKAAASRPEWQLARLAATLALNTTMRACEIRGLQWRDIDFMEKTLTVRRSKTETGERVLPLNTAAWTSILELRQRSKLLFNSEPEPTWYLFPHGEGQGPVTQPKNRPGPAVSVKPDPTKPMTTWRTAWRNLTKVAGLPGFRFHDLRHHAITELAESSASDQTIMAIAGHVSQKMLALYSHVRLEARRQALDALSKKPEGAVTSQTTSQKEEPKPQVIENMVDVTGFEPATPCLQSRCSPS